MVKLGYQSRHINKIANSLQEKYGTAVDIGLTAIDAMTGGAFRAIVHQFMGATIGDKLGEYLEQGKEYAVDKVSGMVNKMDPYLSKASSKDIAAVIVGTLGVAIVGKEIYSDFKYGKGKFDHSKDDWSERAAFKHFIEVDEGLLKKEIKLPDDYNSPKLRKKFDSHKEHFDMEDFNYNKQNAELFKQKIETHIKHEDTIAIAGTHRGTEKVIHYYNKKTQINVMKGMDGEFVSGWKLGEEQIKSLETKGNLQ